MNWNEHMVGDETIVWQGKPAPRCYTLRNWPHSLFGLVLLLSCLVWFYVGINLEHDVHQSIYSWIPVPFLFASIYLIVGHLLLARLEWNSIYYAVSDKRILLHKGLFRKTVSSLPLEEITWFRLKPYSVNLGSVSIRGREHDQKLLVSCIEQPRQFTDLLEAAMQANGTLPVKPPTVTQGDSH